MKWKRKGQKHRATAHGMQFSIQEKEGNFTLSFCSSDGLWTKEPVAFRIKKDAQFRARELATRTEKQNRLDKEALVLRRSNAKAYVSQSARKEVLSLQVPKMGLLDAATIAIKAVVAGAKENMAK